MRILIHWRDVRRRSSRALSCSSQPRFASSSSRIAPEIFRESLRILVSNIDRMSTTAKIEHLIRNERMTSSDDSEKMRNEAQTM